MIWTVSAAVNPIPIPTLPTPMQLARKPSKQPIHVLRTAESSNFRLLVVVVFVALGIGVAVGTVAVGFYVTTEAFFGMILVPTTIPLLECIRIGGGGGGDPPPPHPTDSSSRRSRRRRLQRHRDAGLLKEDSRAPVANNNERRTIRSDPVRVASTHPPAHQRESKYCRRCRGLLCDSRHLLTATS
jgi:hypothetical protein